MESFGRHYRHIWLRKIDIYALTRVSGCANVWRNTISDGTNVAHATRDELAIIRNKKIGFVFQKFHLLPDLTILDNVALPMLYAAKSEADARKI